MSELRVMLIANSAARLLDRPIRKSACGVTSTPSIIHSYPYTLSSFPLTLSNNRDNQHNALLWNKFDARSESETKGMEDCHVTKSILLMMATLCRFRLWIIARVKMSNWIFRNRIAWRQDIMSKPSHSSSPHYTVFGNRQHLLQHRPCEKWMM